MLHTIGQIFHELWGCNKDLVYDKKKWMELQRQLEELEQDIKNLSLQQLQEKYVTRLTRNDTARERMENDMQQFEAIYSDHIQQMEQSGYYRL